MTAESIETNEDRAAAPPPWAGELVEEIRAQALLVEQQALVVERQAAVIEAQQATLVDLQARFDRLEHTGPVAAEQRAPARDRTSSDMAPVDRAPGASTENGDAAAAAGSADGERLRMDAPTSRRSLITRGAAVAAGTVVAGAGLAVAGATPAAAASGTFDGNPAVSATAAPSTGTAVFGAAGGAGGIGINGYASATSGNSRGVVGGSTSPDGIGVVGDNFATAGRAEGVRGYTASTAGRGVYGWAPAANGTAVGVEGEASSPDGAGVLGLNLATGGEASGVVGRTASTTGVGVHGIAEATSGETNGVRGVSSSPVGRGVFGRASAVGGLTIGVLGQADSPTGTGVHGIGGSDGYGVLASGGSAAVLAFSNACQLILAGTPAAPLSAGRASSVGEILSDVNGDLWTCVTTGVPGTWRRLAGRSTAGALVVLPSPKRVYDSRVGEPPTTAPKTPLAPRTARPVDLTLNGSGVPKGSTAALVSLIAVNHTAGGFLAAYQDGTAYPGTSNLTFEAGLNPSVTTVVACSPAGRIAVYANVTTDVVVDVVGWYQ